MPTIKPLEDRVVIEVLDAEERTAGGIVLPDTAREKPQRGRVTAVGQGRLARPVVRRMVGRGLLRPDRRRECRAQRGDDEGVCFHLPSPLVSSLLKNSSNDAPDVVS